MDDNVYTMTITLTKTVIAESEKEAYKKAVREFLDDGIDPNEFYIYLNGKAVN